MYDIVISVNGIVRPPIDNMTYPEVIKAITLFSKVHPDVYISIWIDTFKFVNDYYQNDWIPR